VKIQALTGAILSDFMGDGTVDLIGQDQQYCQHSVAECTISGYKKAIIKNIEYATTYLK